MKKEVIPEMSEVLEMAIRCRALGNGLISSAVITKLTASERQMVMSMTVSEAKRKVAKMTEKPQMSLDKALEELLKEQ